MNWQDLGALIAVVGVIAAAIGGFVGSYFSKRSNDVSDANQTIALKDSTIKALDEKVKDLENRANEQDKVIAKVQADLAAYVRLFQGNPSELERYMRDTAASMAAVAETQKTILSMLHSQPNITINK